MLGVSNRRKSTGSSCQLPLHRFEPAVSPNKTWLAMSFLHNMVKICWHLGLLEDMSDEKFHQCLMNFFERLNNVTRVIFKSTFLVVCTVVYVKND